MLAAFNYGRCVLTVTRKGVRWCVLLGLLSSAFAWLFMMNQAFALHPRLACVDQVKTPCNHLLAIPPAILGGPGGPIQQMGGDTGDAPDSRQQPMTAYIYETTTVTANFPTIYMLGIPSGPYHHNPGQGAYLGQAISQELNAHLLPDDDGQMNINPPLDLANGDALDDGLGWLHGLENPCAVADLTYSVTVEAENTPFYLNVWLDFNRDGAWGYTASCADESIISEWAVKNHVVNIGGITGTITGTIFFVTTDFSGSGYDPLWARVTLSEQPATMPDGSGPPSGFSYGETEDYLLRPIKPKQDPLAGWRG